MVVDAFNIRVWGKAKQSKAEQSQSTPDLSEMDLADKVKGAGGRKYIEHQHHSIWDGR